MSVATASSSPAPSPHTPADRILQSPLRRCTGVVRPRGPDPAADTAENDRQVRRCMRFCDTESPTDVALPPLPVSATTTKDAPIDLTTPHQPQVRTVTMSSDGKRVPVLVRPDPAGFEDVPESDSDEEGPTGDDLEDAYRESLETAAQENAKTKKDVTDAIDVYLDTVRSSYVKVMECRMELMLRREVLKLQAKLNAPTLTVTASVPETPEPGAAPPTDARSTVSEEY